MSDEGEDASVAAGFGLPEELQIHSFIHSLLDLVRGVVAAVVGLDRISVELVHACKEGAAVLRLPLLLLLHRTESNRKINQGSDPINAFSQNKIII